MGNNLVVNSLIMVGILLGASAIILAVIAVRWGRGLLFRIVILTFCVSDFVGIVMFWIGQAGVQLWTVGAALVFSIPIVLTMIYVIQRVVVRPVQLLTRNAQRLAVGDLAVDFSHHSTDEIGQLAAASRDAVAYQQAMADVAERLAAGDLTIVAPRAATRTRWARPLLKWSPGCAAWSGECILAPIR
jgi:methyl-accepting chemotaxis protein